MASNELGERTLYFIEIELMIPHVSDSEDEKSDSADGQDQCGVTTAIYFFRRTMSYYVK